MAKTVNIGDKFGKLTVVSKSDTKRWSCLEWCCICECGNTKIAPTNYLTTGQTWHCGCSTVHKKPKDITGVKKNLLTARESTGEKSKNGDYIWIFDCDCGGEVETTIGRFNYGHTKSCGCLIKDAPKLKDNYHGMQNTKTYNSWRKMRERCNNPNDTLFEDYGGSGITVCEAWNTSFLQFYEDMGDCPEGFTIDRIDNTKGYYKENCRWASSFVQGRNKGSYKGTSKYKGVQYEKSSNKWIATISVGKYKAKKIGRYPVEEDAGKAYNLASELIFKEDKSYLHLNNLDQDYSNVNMNCKFFRYWVDILREEYLNLYRRDLNNS